MEDETLGFFKKTSSSHARLNVPALVQVAALAIIMIRGLDVLMIFNTLVEGTNSSIRMSISGSFCSIRLWKISRFDSPGMLNSSG